MTDYLEEVESYDGMDHEEFHRLFNNSKDASSMAYVNVVWCGVTSRNGIAFISYI